MAPLWQCFTALALCAEPRRLQEDGVNPRTAAGQLRGAMAICMPCWVSEISCPALSWVMQQKMTEKLPCACHMTGRLSYSRECQLLRAAAELLRLPQPVIATSLTFLHRYYRACPDAAADQQVGDVLNMLLVTPDRPTTHAP